MAWSFREVTRVAIGTYEDLINGKGVLIRHTYVNQKDFLVRFDYWSFLLFCIQIETRLLQESKAKLREMERLGQALDKKGVCTCVYSMDSCCMILLTSSSPPMGWTYWLGTW